MRTTVQIQIAALAWVLCVLLGGQLVAQTPDGSPPSQKNVCNGLSGAAFGLCTAYCEAQDCDRQPHPSCNQLRRNFQRLTGSSVFPCDAFCGDGVINQATEQCDPPGSPSCPGSLLCKQDCTCPPPTQSCTETQPTPEEIQSAVIASMAGLSNPWGNASQFDLLLSRTEAKLGCVLRENGIAPASQSLLPQVQVQGCAAAGVNYCGPGTSQAGIAVPAPGCLNDACCEHDRCYAADCVASACVFMPQSQACDNAPASVIDTCNGLGGCGLFDLLDPRAIFVCTVAKCLNTSFPFNTGACLDLRVARLLLNPQCLDPATCQCSGQTCETFTTCNPGSACAFPVCGSTAEGGGVCVEGATPCAGLSNCITSADCGGGICFVNTCCGRPVCVSSAAFCPDIGASTSPQATVPGNGPTIGHPD